MMMRMIWTPGKMTGASWGQSLRENWGAASSNNCRDIVFFMIVTGKLMTVKLIFKNYLLKNIFRIKRLNVLLFRLIILEYQF